MAGPFFLACSSGPAPASAGVPLWLGGGASASDAAGGGQALMWAWPEDCKRGGVLSPGSTLTPRGPYERLRPPKGGVGTRGIG